MHFFRDNRRGLRLSASNGLVTRCCPFPSDYPHKYGPEGGCADHSVFEKMKKFQSSVVEEPALVNPYHTATTLLSVSASDRSTRIITVIRL